MRTRTTRSKGNGFGHASQGPGWGGPARGASRSRKAPLFTPGNRAAATHAAPDRERLAAERERVERTLDALLSLAENAPNEATQVAAAVAFMNRVEGPCGTAAEVAAESADAAPRPSGIAVRFADE